MRIHCPYCVLNPDLSDYRTCVIRRGYFKRKSDSQRIRRYHCKRCKKYFSSSLFTSAYRQKKRHKNEFLRKLLASQVSMRRSAELLGLNRKTVARKLLYLGQQSLAKLRERNLEKPKAHCVEFDDQETFEHTKCKPLSITLAVESKSRRILAFEISQMAAKGHLSKIALKKYGKRIDTRFQARQRVFFNLKELVEDKVTFKSDQNPFYPDDVRRHFPHSRHETFKGQRGSVVGQGELKKIRFDPIFSLNHTCAMTRANINRLARKTWCTTKLREKLVYHFAIYAVFHNERLKPPPPSAA